MSGRANAASAAVLRGKAPPPPSFRRRANAGAQRASIDKQGLSAREKKPVVQDPSPFQRDFVVATKQKLQSLIASVSNGESQRGELLKLIQSKGHVVGGTDIVQMLSAAAAQGKAVDPQLWNEALAIAADPRRKVFDSIGTSAVIKEMQKFGVPPLAKHAEKVMQGFSIAREPKSVLRVLDWARENGVRVTAKHWSQLMRAYARADNVDAALNVMDDMWRSGVPPDELMYSYAISLLGRQKRLKEVQEMDSLMQSRGIERSEIGTHALMAAYTTCGQPKMALKVVDELREASPVSMDTSTYNHAMNAHLKLQQYEEVLRLHDEMSARKHEMDKYTATYVIRAKGKMGDVAGAKREARSAFQAKQGDLFVKNALLEAYAGNGRMSEAVDELHAMYRHKAKSMLPNADSYNTLIEGYGQLGQHAEATNMFAKMKREGVLPNLRTYHHLIWSLLEQKDVGGARVMMERMAAEGITPTIKTYGLLLSGYVRNQRNGGDPGETLRVMAEIKESGLAPDVTCYNMALTAFAKRDDVDGLLKTMREMEAGAIELSTVTYNTLLTTLGRLGRDSQATEWFATMLRRGVDVSTVTYNALVAAYANSGNFDAAFTAASEIPASGLTMDAATVTTIVDAVLRSMEPKAREVAGDATLSRRDQLEYIARARKLMLDNGIQPDDKLCSALVRFYIFQGQRREALSVFEDIAAMKVAPSLRSLHSLMASSLRENDPKAAVHVFEKACKFRVEINALAMRLLIRSYVAMGRNDALNSVLQDALKRKIELDSSFYADLIDAHVSCGNRQRAMALMHRVERDPELEKDAALLTAMMGAHALEGDIQAVQVLWKSFEDRDLHPPAKAISTVLVAIGKSAMATRVQSFREHLHSRNLPLNEDNYLRLVEAYASCGKYVDAIKVLNEMLQKFSPLLNPGEAYQVITSRLEEANQHLLRERVRKHFLQLYPDVVHEAQVALASVSTSLPENDGQEPLDLALSVPSLADNAQVQEQSVGDDQRSRISTPSSSREILPNDARERAEERSQDRTQMRQVFGTREIRSAPWHLRSDEINSPQNNNRNQERSWAGQNQQVTKSHLEFRNRGAQSHQARGHGEPEYRRIRVISDHRESSSSTFNADADLGGSLRTRRGGTYDRSARSFNGHRVDSRENASVARARSNEMRATAEGRLQQEGQSPNCVPRRQTLRRVAPSRRHLRTLQRRSLQEETMGTD